MRTFTICERPCSIQAFTTMMLGVFLLAGCGGPAGESDSESSSAPPPPPARLATAVNPTPEAQPVQPEPPPVQQEPVEQQPIAPPPIASNQGSPVQTEPVIGRNIGSIAPDIFGEDIDGVELKLSDYRGKVVVLDFWGDW